MVPHTIISPEVSGYLLNINSIKMQLIIRLKKLIFMKVKSSLLKLTNVSNEMNLLYPHMAFTDHRRKQKKNWTSPFNYAGIRCIVLLGLFWISLTTLLFAQTYGQNGMVVSSSHWASDAGIKILKKGGNAIDASIAAAFALAVTLPSAGNLGGGGFLIFSNEQGKVISIDFREKAPLKASPKMFLDEEGKLIEESNHRSILSIGVPGTVAGLFLAHQKYGTLPWKDLVQPAIELAQEGFSMSWSLFQEAHWFRDHTKPGDFMHHFFENESGNLTLPGNQWKQPALAKTLTLIRDYGQDAFYRGSVAESISSFMKKNGGIITTQDFDQYHAIERLPVHGTFRDHDIYSMGPPSSGGICLVQMLNMLETVPVDSIPFNSTNYVHLMAELMRRTFADRAKYLGDPDFNSGLPIGQLISKSYAQQCLSNFNWNRANVSDTSILQPIQERDHTTHLSVMDHKGNAVSLTYTLEDWYGSRIGIPELGFIFNNEMGDFNPVPGTTNQQGQIGTAPNTIAPGKRMLSSMTPTIILKQGKPVMVIGSPGGRTIINTVFQTIVNVLQYKMPLKHAIEAMKIHHQWLPDEVVYENYLLSPDTVKALEEKGHRMRSVSNLGSLMGILFDTKNRLFIGTADSSAADGEALGY